MIINTFATSEDIRRGISKSTFHKSTISKNACRVIAVEMSPVNDTVMTSSLDQTVRLWDLRSSTCQVVSTLT